jgi:hypothetical protein
MTGAESARGWTTTDMQPLRRLRRRSQNDPAVCDLRHFSLGHLYESRAPCSGDYQVITMPADYDGDGKAE